MQNSHSCNTRVSICGPFQYIFYGTLCEITFIIIALITQSRLIVPSVVLFSVGLLERDEAHRDIVAYEELRIPIERHTLPLHRQLTSN